MKSVLVIDVPMAGDEKHLCDKCPIWNDNLLSCQFDLKTGHKGCPLKPLPEQYTVDKAKIIGKGQGEKMYILGTANGWNACIEEIER